MEFKKKTIIWEDNNEPPKDYIWAKKDGKFYEYNYVTRSWVESKSISGGSGGSGSETDFDEQELITSSINSLISKNSSFAPEMLERIVYPDCWTYYDGELQEFKIIKTIEDGLMHWLDDNIKGWYKESPDTHNFNYFIHPRTLSDEDSRISEHFVDGITYYAVDSPAS